MKELFKRLLTIAVGVLFPLFFRHNVQQYETASKQGFLVFVFVTIGFLMASVLSKAEESRYGAAHAFCFSLGFTIGMALALSH